jgi:hypothetical protein
MSFRPSSIRLRRPALRGRGVLARALASLWMVLYLGMVAAAPVADGFVDHDQPVAMHIEDAEGGDCPASHSGEACDICQLAHGLRAVLAPQTVVIPSAAALEIAALGARGVAPVELSFLDGRSSRAPPLV